jgi:VanZ family protein
MRPVSAQSADRPVALRGWCAALAALTAAFAAYISLVPFNFTLPAGTTVYDAFRQALEADLHSRSNFAGNVLLFTPIGFFGGGALFPGPSRRAGRLVAAVALLVGSLAWSGAIEFVQVLVPGRTPSLADVIAQTSGVLAGMAAWRLLSKDIQRWADGRRAERGHTALEVGLLVFAAGRTVAMLLPLDVTLDLGLLAEKYRGGRIVLDPMQSPALSMAVLPSVLADVAFAMPIGVLACVAGMPPGRRRSAAPALLMASLFVGTVEAAQVVVVSRTADVVDWLASVIGVAAGVWLTTWALPRRLPEPSRRRALAFAGLAGSLGFCVLYNWSPFDFDVSAGAIRSRLPMLFGVPFHGYYENPELQAVGELLVKIGLGVPIGVFLGWWVRASFEPYRRLAVSLGVVSAAIFLAGVEAGQILLASRYPDNTDILLGLTGVLAGLFVGRRFPSV